MKGRMQKTEKTVVSYVQGIKYLSYSLERTLANRGYGIWNGNLRQAGATRERPPANRGNAICNLIISNRFRNNNCTIVRVSVIHFNYVAVVCYTNGLLGFANVVVVNSIDFKVVSPQRHCCYKHQE